MITMNPACERNLPHGTADIHPWMPRALHVPTPNCKQQCNYSPLGDRLSALEVSIHNREEVEKVYAQMRQEELLPRK